MKKQSAFYTFIKQLNSKEIEKKKQIKSMKAFLYHPLDYIKSQNLLNNFSSIKKKEKTKIEYLVINNLFDQYNKEFSFSNYNNKVGLNAPLSYNDSDYNNSFIELNEKTKNEKFNKSNKLLNTNYQNNIKINNKNEIKINYTPKNLKSNFNINKIKKMDIIKHTNNNIKTKLIKKSIKNNDDKSIYKKEKGEKLNQNKTNNNIKISDNNKDISYKKYKIKKHSKSALNKNNKHIIYNVLNIKNYIFINNEISKSKMNCIYKNKNFSNIIIFDFDDIKTRNSYNINKGYSQKKMNLKKSKKNNNLSTSLSISNKSSFNNINNIRIINNKKDNIVKNIKDIKMKKNSEIKNIKNLIIKEKEINEEIINNKYKNILNKNNFDNKC